MRRVHNFRAILESQCTDDCTKFKHNLKAERTQLAIEESPEFSPHKCIKCTAPLGAILSEINPEASWMTPTHQAAKKIPD